MKKASKWESLGSPKQLIVVFFSLFVFSIILFVSGVYYLDAVSLPWIQSRLDISDVSANRLSEIKLAEDTIRTTGVNRSIYFCRLTMAKLNENPLKVCNEVIEGYLGYDKWDTTYQLQIAKNVNLQYPVGTNPVDTTCSVIQWDVYDQVFVKYSADARNYCHYEEDNNHCSFEGQRTNFDKKNLDRLKVQFDLKCGPATPTPTVRATSTPPPVFTVTPIPTVRITNTVTPVPTVRVTNTATPTLTPTVRVTNTPVPTNPPRACTQRETRVFYSGEFVAHNTSKRNYKLADFELSEVAKKHDVRVKAYWGWTGAANQKGRADAPLVQNNERHLVLFRLLDNESSAAKSASIVCDDLGNTLLYNDGMRPLLKVSLKFAERYLNQRFLECRNSIKIEQDNGSLNFERVLHPEGKFDRVTVNSLLDYSPESYATCLRTGNKKKCAQSHYSRVIVDYCVKE